MRKMDESKALVPLTREQIELIKRTVAKEATDDELKLFLYTAQKYNLDPFLKEIVFVKRKTEKYGEIVNFITTRDGYLKIAMQDPDFLGLQSGVVREGDFFEVIPTEGKVVHKFGEKRGKIICGYAIALHKKRMPVIFVADFEEYYNANQYSPVWKQYPSVMIQKVAEVGALRRQFNISGIVAREEMYISEEEIDSAHEFKSQEQQKTSSAITIEETKQEQKTKPSKRDYQEFWKNVRDIGLSVRDIQEITGVPSLKELDNEHYTFLEEMIQKVKSGEIPLQNLQRLHNLKNYSSEDLKSFILHILFNDYEGGDENDSNENTEDNV